MMNLFTSFFIISQNLQKFFPHAVLMHLLTFIKKKKSKSTKIKHSKEKLKRKIPYQIAKFKAETHQTNGKQLGTGGSLC